MESRTDKTAIATDFNIYKELSKDGKTREALDAALFFLESFQGRGLDRDAVEFVKNFQDSETYNEPIERECFEDFQRRVVHCVGGSYTSLSNGSIIQCEVPTAPFFSRSYEQYLAKSRYEVGEISASENYDSQPPKVTRYRFDEIKGNVFNALDPEDLAFEHGDVVVGVDEYSLPPVHGIRKDGAPSLGLFAKVKSAVDEFGAPIPARDLRSSPSGAGHSLKGSEVEKPSATAAKARVIGDEKANTGRAHH